MFVIVSRGRGRETAVVVVPQENYRDRARGRDSCAVRTKPVAAFTSRKLAPRGTSTFWEFSKRRNEPVTSLHQEQFAAADRHPHLLCNLLGQISVFEPTGWEVSQNGRFVRAGKFENHDGRG